LTVRYFTGHFISHLTPQKPFNLNRFHRTHDFIARQTSIKTLEKKKNRGKKEAHNLIRILLDLAHCIEELRTIQGSQP